MTIDELLRAAAPRLISSAMEDARARHRQLTKPSGSLGELEELSIRLAGIYGKMPVIGDKCVLVFAGDHGVAVRHVSAYPISVTRQMVENFDAGGAAINVLTRLVAAKLVVLDVGVRRAVDVVDGEQMKRTYIGGTRDLCVEAALSDTEMRVALEAGMLTAKTAMGSGANLIAIGEMGIGNTTSAAAITAVMCGETPEAVTGPGTGLAGRALERKAKVVASAVERIGPLRDPIGVLRELGGFEIAAMVGALLHCAHNRVPVVLDGFVVGAAALIAKGICIGAENYFIAGHRSSEPGHRVQLNNLRLRPLLDLDMRLGEGSGACLALPLVEGACRILSEMSTFDEASVSREEAE